MHQYKTIIQILLFLSILNLVYAAPVPRVVTTGSDRRRGTPPGGTTPLQGPAPSSESAPLSTDGQVPVPDSNTEASTSSPATNKPVSVSDSTAGGSTTSQKPSRKFYQNPTEIGAIALMLGVPVAEAMLIYSAFHNSDQKHDNDNDKDS